MITNTKELYQLAQRFIDLTEDEVENTFKKPFIMAETLDEEMLIEKIQEIIQQKGSKGVKQLLNWII